MDKQPASTTNSISFNSYCLLGGCLNSDLVKLHHTNGSHHYTTYHHVGYGVAYWKQDKQKDTATNETNY